MTVLTMLVYYKIENMVLSSFTSGDDDDDSYLNLGVTFLPSIVYSIVVMVYGMVYSFIAVGLTNWGMYICY